MRASRVIIRTHDTAGIMRFDEPGLEAYLKEIDQIRLLRRKEEEELARRVAEGDAAARDRMIRANLRLVVHMARQYARPGVSLMDLIAEGNIGLMKAVERFDPGRHTRFSTYAAWWIRQYIRRGMQLCGPTVRVPGYMVELVSRWKRVSQELTEELARPPTDYEVAERMSISPHRLRMINRAIRASGTLDNHADMSWVFEGAFADERTSAPDDELISEENRRLIMRCMEALSEREAEIMSRRFGLYTGTPLTLDAIGKRLGLTRERVRQIEAEALKKLSAAYRAGGG